MRIRVHIEHRKEQFIDRQAASFPELQAYLARTLRERDTFKLYEVAISDNGLGIIDRFLTTKPEFMSHQETIQARAELVNKIILEALSSKQTQAGAGHGLQKALKAVDKLQGFVSLRTDRLWLYRSPVDGSASAHDRPLLPVSVQNEYAPVAGTHFNMLFPMA